MSFLPRSFVSAGMVLAATLAATRMAAATPTLQAINNVPIGPSQLLESPDGPGWPTFTSATTFDRDPAKPWLIEIQNPAVAGGASVARVGAVGASPTTPVTPDAFSGPGELHPLSVIVGMSDSYVYRVDAQTGECVWKTYIGRTTATTINFPGCVGGIPDSQIQCPNELGGTVAFLSGNSGADASNVNFYVPTAYDEVASGDDPPECGTIVDNRLYALNAATGAPSWVFNVDETSPTPYAANETPPQSVNGIVADPDYDAEMWDECTPTNLNRLIFGTIDPHTGQDTLFSVSNGAPGVAGQLEWSAQMGDIQQPLGRAWGQALTCQHIYVTTEEGAFETVGTTPAACGGGAVPCLVFSLPHLFAFSSPLGYTNMFWDRSSPLFGKLVVATHGTVYVLNDSGPTTSIYCVANTLQSKFPTLNAGPTALTESLWVGADDRSGHPALVGFEIPTKAPPAPFDCGSAFVAFPQAGEVGEVNTTLDFAKNTRVMYVAIDGSAGSSVLVANFTE